MMWTEEHLDTLRNQLQACGRVYLLGEIMPVTLGQKLCADLGIDWQDVRIGNPDSDERGWLIVKPAEERDNEKRGPEQEYTVVLTKRVPASEADALAGRLSDLGRVSLYKMATEQCDATPGHRADHAHISYDGGTFCTGCNKYLSIRVEKKT